MERSIRILGESFLASGLNQVPNPFGSERHIDVPHAQVAERIHHRIDDGGCRTPKWLSASTTELTMAGDAPMVPASPTPFTHSGFTGEGVHVWALSIHGIMLALGTA